MSLTGFLPSLPAGFAFGGGFPSVFFSFRLCSRGLQNLRRNDAEDGDDDADLEHSFPGLGRPMFASLATNAGSPTRPLYDEAAFQRYARSLVVVEFHRYPVACANRLGPSCDSPGIGDTDDCPERSFVKSLCPAGHPGRATEQTVPRERESDCRKGSSCLDPKKRLESSTLQLGASRAVLLSSSI